MTNLRLSLGSQRGEIGESFAEAARLLDAEDDATVDVTIVCNLHAHCQFSGKNVTRQCTMAQHTASPFNNCRVCPWHLRYFHGE